MTPEDHTHAIHALRTDVSEIREILNNGVTITGARIAPVLSIIGYLLVNPVGSR